uniref:Uncharacterized protein n=1 Tax=Phaeomonas parva TaxID=124430 RepID=A0A7S1XVX9_9STRA|mmetsp:Transcript_3877/g.11223  ORF Transcript_3877/g.11223 Transcript_3877/m.11223 type:complete len:446 (+) Transcript_3877:217-1554(+)
MPSESLASRGRTRSGRDVLTRRATLSPTSLRQRGGFDEETEAFCFHCCDIALASSRSLAERCNREKLAKALALYGISDEITLDAVVDTPTSLDQLSKFLAPHAPPAFTAVLAASWRNRGRNRGASHSSNSVAESNPEPSHLPSKASNHDATPNLSWLAYMGRYASIVPMYEFMVPKDHLPSYKMHWCEAMASDGGRLRDSLVFLHEVELIMSSLLFSTLLGVYFDAIDEDVVADFVNFKFDTPGFWAALFGTLASLLSMLQFACDYIIIMLLAPLADANVYAIVKTAAVQRCEFIASFVLVACFYSSVNFVICLFLALNGTGLMSLILTFSCTFGVFGAILMYINLAFNLAVKSGAFGEKQVMADDVVVELSGAAVEAHLHSHAMEKVKAYGTSVNAAKLYYGADPAPKRASGGRGFGGGMVRKVKKKVELKDQHKALRMATIAF